MNLELLEKLSNADGIASMEDEVRQILYSDMKDRADDVCFDRLGSIIFKKQGRTSDLKIMMSGHMDEVGFKVRSIDDKGMIHLIELGRVKPLAKFMQEVRITTREGAKIRGIINATLDKENGEAKTVYVDIGAKTSEDVEKLGIRIGDMATYTTEFKEFALNGIVAGKAFDDRLGCFVMSEVLTEISDMEHDNDVYFAGTVAEEVGIRGARTATQKIKPDLFIAIDVACYQNEFDRSSLNKRQIGKGPMLIKFDRTLAPSEKMLNFIEDLSYEMDIDIQLDMFNGGGTDAGAAHLVGEGIPSVVLCLPVRYGHCAYSIAEKKDMEALIKILTALIGSLNKNKYDDVIRFI